LATHTKSADTSPKRKTLVSALALVGDPHAAARLADWRGYGVNDAAFVAKDPRVIKQVEAIRFRRMSEEIVPLALGVIVETLRGAPGRARDDMARWAVKEWKDEHGSVAGGVVDGDLDLSNASQGQLARMIQELEVQQAALETIAAGKAKDVTPSTDVIDAGDHITEIDPFS
jgi:hypothetical protein